MRNGRKGYVWNFIIIGGMTVLTLWLSLKNQYHEVMNLIFGIPWYWLLLISVWGLLGNWIGGKILCLYAHHFKPKYRLKEGVINSLVGSFFSGITPSSTGGQFAQVYLFKKQGIPYSGGASILWTDFMLYQTSLVLFVTVLFILKFQHYLNMMNQALMFFIFLGYITNVVIIILLWMMVLKPSVYLRLCSGCIHLLKLIHIIKDEQQAKIKMQEKVSSFSNNIKNLKKEKYLFIKSICWNLLRFIIQFGLPWMIVRSLGYQIAVYEIIDYMALSSFVVMANTFIPIPGASGGSEFVFSSLFSQVLPHVALASSVMILWRFSTFHLVMLVSGIVCMMQRHRYHYRVHH